MSDSFLRELQKRYDKSCDASDRNAYAHELKRRGDFGAVANLYSPLLEERCDQRVLLEFLDNCALNPEHKKLIQYLPRECNAWLYGLALVSPDYEFQRPKYDAPLIGIQTRRGDQRSQLSRYFRRHISNPVIKLCDKNYTIVRYKKQILEWRIADHPHLIAPMLRVR